MARGDRVCAVLPNRPETAVVFLAVAIDAPAGFITSPRGSQVFQLQCSKCHEQPVIASGNPLEIKRAIDQGTRLAAAL